MRLRHVVLLAAVLALPVLGVACNGILGIGVPTLQDASIDAPPTADVTPPNDSGPTMDATLDSVRPPVDGSLLDAPDGLLDSGAPVFDGNCSCPDWSCDPVTIASGQTDPARIAVDFTGVYWVNSDQSAGSVWHANLDGSNVQRLASNQLLPHGIAYGNGIVYWTDTIAANVNRCAANACNPMPIDMAISGPEGIAVTTTKAYVASGGGRAIYAYDLADASKTVVAGDAGSPFSVTTDSTNVYWTSGIGVYGCPLTGCTSAPTQFGASPGPSRLATNGVTLFWTDGDFVVYSAPVTLGATTALFTASNPGGIAADATHVYVTTMTQLLRADLDGGNQVVLATLGSPRDVALAGTCAYWLDDTVDAGHVFASAK